MKVRLSSWVVAFIATTWIGSASAATITPSGITGLDVGGVLYDVAIGDMGGQTPQEVYGTVTANPDDLYAAYGLSRDPAIDNPTLVAVNAALFALIVSDPNPVGPTFFDGCSLASDCVLFSPTKIFNNSFPTGSLFAQDTIRWGGGIWGQSPVTLNQTALPSNITFAYVSTSAVPLPAAAWLFISALGGLVVAKRKQLKA